MGLIRSCKAAFEVWGGLFTALPNAIQSLIVLTVSAFLLVGLFKLFTR